MNLNGNGVRELTHGYWHDGAVDSPSILRTAPGSLLQATAVAMTRGSGSSEPTARIYDASLRRALQPDSLIGRRAGRTIVFTGGTHVPFIGLVLPDGRGLHRIGPVVCCAQYSPDGKRFTVHDDARPGLSVMNSDGSGLHLVPGVPVSVGDSAWGAAP